MFLSIQKISHQFLSAKDISLSVDVGDKIGLIGKNSVGKSTLLRIIAGSIQPSTGSVCRTAKIHFIDNSIRFNKTNNFVWEYISDYNDNWWDVLSWINVQFNNEIKFDSKVSSLSGGELTKVIVSLAFFSLSDLILLDEPTNNLDLYSIERLIDLINESKKSFIIVSHNVDFINKCINKIWCIKDNKIVVCSGNYNEYKLIEENRANANLRKYINGIKQQKRECKIFQEKVIKSQRQISNLKRKIQKRDMPRGYLNKLKNNATAGLSSVFLSHNKNAEKLQEGISKYKPLKSRKVFVDFNYQKYNATLVSVVNGKLDMQGKNILKNINFEIDYGDRVLISGRNGSGKTLFLNSMFSSVKGLVIKGQISLNNNIVYEYLDQKCSMVNKNIKVIDNLLKSSNKVNYEFTRKLLSDVLLGNKIDNLATELSEGEFVRLAIGIAMSRKVNMLIIDEINNGLDIDSLESLIYALNNYKGALIVVSHDLFFVSRLNINKKYEIVNNEMRKSSWEEN